MLEEFVDSVLIIDDKEDEIEGLRKVLEDKDIWVKYLSPDNCNKKLKSRKLLFIDLHLDVTAGGSLEAHISKIRKILQTLITKDNDSYGLIIWSNHTDEMKEFKSKIQNDTEYLKPLFIIGVSKQKYSENGYDNLLIDIERKLKESTAANFFINWSNLIKKGKDKAITSIYELIPDYQKQDKNLEFLLFKMAQNYTGIPFDKIDDEYPLSIDAIKAFNDLLVSEINSISESNDISIKKDNNIFILKNEDKGWCVSNELSMKKKDLVIKKVNFNEEIDNWDVSNNLTVREKTNVIVNSSKDELIELFSKVNTKLLIDYVNIGQDKIIPGNVYRIIKRGNKLIHPELPQEAIPIIIEMTPPCDFSNNKTVYPRVLSGYMIDYGPNRLPKQEKYYKELWPIKIKDTEKPQIIIFDFSILGFEEEEDLKNGEEYELLFRVKDKVFADILQKMSSYMARLGLAIVR